MVTASAVAAVLYFAIEGGEWGTAALLRQRSHTAALQDTVKALEHVVDTLGRYKQLVLNDPATQERIARESFGYSRQNEVVYRVVDSTRADTGAARNSKARKP